MGLREFIDKRPMVGWGAAAAIGLAATLMTLRNFRGGETAQLTQIVTIRCRETGKEWTMPRGAMEKQLMMRPYPVNPDEGLPNPETGRFTGFPVDDWTLTVERVNATRAPLAEKSGTATGGAGSPASPPKR